MTTPTRTPVTSDDDDARGRQTLKGVQPKPAPDVEVGVSSFLPWQTPYKNQWEALKSDDVTVRQLVAMRRTDGQARALYRLITLPIRAALKTATFVPEDNVDGGDEEAVFIQQMFTLPSTGGGMEVPFGRFMAQLLMAVFDGFEVFEMVYWQPQTGPLKGKYTLKKLAHRPSEQLTFILDDDANLAGVRQQTMYHDKHIDVVIPGENIVYYAANEEERPFYGISYFNAAYKHWEAKFKLYVVAHIAAQRAAVGTRVGTTPQSPQREEKVEFQRALAELGIAQWMTIPENYKVESLKESTGFDFLAYINHHNSQMSKSVLAAFFDDSQGTGGDASLVDFGRQSDSLFLLMLQTIMGEIEEVINTKIIPRFIDWNFDSQKYPLFRFGTMTDEQKGALLDIFKALAAAGESMVVAPEMFREIEKMVAEEFGLEVDWEAVADREEEEAALAEEALQLEQINNAGGPTAPDATTPTAGGNPRTLPPHGANIDPTNVPEGFALSTGDDGVISLSDMAADLLDDAIATLTRGRAGVGFKVVRSLEGAKTYGVPVGTRITRDMDKKLGSRGVEGKKYGYNQTKRDPADKTKRRTPEQARKQGGSGDNNTRREVLGGGPGDTGNNPGVNTAGGAKDAVSGIQRVYSNPNQPGAQLIDYGDGTVAIRDADGKLTPRQRFDVGRFKRYGWKIDDTDATPNPDGRNQKAADQKKKS